MSRCVIMSFVASSKGASLACDAKTFAHKATKAAFFNRWRELRLPWVFKILVFSSSSVLVPITVGITLGGEDGVKAVGVALVVGSKRPR